AAYDRLIDGLCDRTASQAAVVDRRTYAVLFRFFRSAYLARGQAGDGVAALAVRWLAGDSLDPDEAHQLGLSAAARRGDPVALEDDEQVKQVLIALAQLAAYRGQPLILCFDQVDNLEPAQAAA